MNVNEWDAPIVKSNAEKEFDRSKEIYQCINNVDKDEFLREAVRNLEIHKNYEKCRKDLVGFFIICLLFAVGVILVLLCDFLLKGAAPYSPKLKGSFLEGQEILIVFLGFVGRLLSFCFGLAGFFWLLNYVIGSLKSKILDKRK